MPAVEVSYLKTYDDPLYPYQVKVASHLQDRRVAATLSRHDFALAKENAGKIHRTLADGNISYDTQTLEAICQIAQKLIIDAPTVIAPNDNAKVELREHTKHLETSIVVLPFEDGKRVYVVRKGAHIHKSESVKITKAFMLTFDKGDQLLGVKHVVRIASRKNARQIHCMQQMDARPDLFPENIDYVEYKPDRIAIYQERAGGDLLNYHNETEKLSTVSKGLELASQLVEAVLYMHQRNLAHRDLKLDNLLFFGKAKALTSIKISDFGYADRVDDSEANKERVGTFTWAAPELRYKGNNPLDPIAIDIWSLGHIFYVFLEGRPAPIHQLFDAEYDLQKQVEQNRKAFNKLIALEAEKEKLATHIDAKLTESIPSSVSCIERPSHVVQREAARITSSLQGVYSLLQEKMMTDSKKLTIVKQLETRWALVTALFEARRLISKAGHLASEEKRAPISIESVSFKQAMVDLLNILQKAQNGPLEVYVQDIYLQLERVARLTSSYEINEENLQSEIAKVKAATFALQAKLKVAHNASKSYLEFLRNKPQEKVRSFKDAVFAMLRIDPKKRQDLATVSRLLKDEIKARKERVEAPAAQSENFLTALFSKILGACIGVNKAISS